MMVKRGECAFKRVDGTSLFALCGHTGFGVTLFFEVCVNALLTGLQQRLGLFPFFACGLSQQVFTALLQLLQTGFIKVVVLALAVGAQMLKPFLPLLALLLPGLLRLLGSFQTFPR